MPEASITPDAPRADIAGLPDSTPLLDDVARLRARWEEDGVLYFRNVIDPAAIAAVREDYIRHLKEMDVIAGEAVDPVWNGIDRVDGKRATKVHDSIWQALTQDPSIDHVVRRFLGEAPRWVPIVVHRTSPPADPKLIDDLFFGRHQDGAFNFGIDFATCWIPLMDIDQTVGGLAVVPGSHKASLYDFPDGMPGKAAPIAPGKIAEHEWRRPDYQVGDLLMFHSMTAHAGLPNFSDRFRLSIDVRYLPESSLPPMVGFVESFDGDSVSLIDGAGEHHRFDIDDQTMVRGPKGSRVLGDELAGVLFEGANIIAVPDHGTHARLVRSVSRKYIDLPASWFTEFPAGWVN